VGAGFLAGWLLLGKYFFPIRSIGIAYESADRLPTVPAGTALGVGVEYL
jgi:hypothetical protein